MRKKIGIAICIIVILAVVIIGISMIAKKDKEEAFQPSTLYDVESAYAEVEPPEGEGPGLSPEELDFVAQILSEKLPDITEPYDILELTTDRIVILKDGEEYTVTY